MFGRSRSSRRHAHDGGPRRTAAEVLEYLNPDLLTTLASLHQAPRSVAEATVQLLPFGSRAALETLNPPLAVAGNPIDESGHYALRLTPFAYEVMAAAAAAEESNPRVIDAWTERAARAAQVAAEQASHAPQ